MKKKLEDIATRIRNAAEKAGRKAEDIGLVAVSKTMEAEIVKMAVEAGVTILGENFIQEARDKVHALLSSSVLWHFIGHLQTNKAKIAVGLFDLIHSVDSLKLALALNRHAGRDNKVQKILIQVNIDDEPTKTGVAVSEATDLIREISSLENLAVRGLMTMPPFFDAPEKARPYFSALRALRDHISDQAISNVSMVELSMGMTGDFEIAIAEGSTLVRIGTAIFGKRK